MVSMHFKTGSNVTKTVKMDCDIWLFKQIIIFWICVSFVIFRYLKLEISLATEALNQPLGYLINSTHLKLRFANATHNSQQVKITQIFAI